MAALGIALTAAIGLAGCGGGGSGDGGSAAAGASAGSGGGASVTAPDFVLSGVAAVGVPLGAAQVDVVDAKGQLLGSTTTGLVDGAYRVALGSKALAGPLLLQARGFDAAGNPQVLHSTVPVVGTAMVANITPLSDAVVAMAMGKDPATVFADASRQSAALASLGQAKVAAEFVKTLIKTQTTDLKLADLAKLDLLGDASFRADKSGVDLLLESLRVSLAPGSAGQMQLQIGAKLMISLAPEVVVDLATASTELAKTTGSALASAIASKLKLVSSFSAALPNLALLDDLGAAINRLIAQGASAATFAASPMWANYLQHNGRQASDLAELFERYAANNWQLGRFQITGCADDKAVTGNCTRIAVAALVSDSSGRVREVFSDVVSYSKTAPSGTPAFSFYGNGKALDFSVQPAAWLARAADGSLDAAAGSGAGVRVQVQGQDGHGTQVIESATVQTPGGFSIALAACAQPMLCISAVPGAVSVPALGNPLDTLVSPAVVGWLGGGDALRNARYQATYAIGGNAQTRSALLGADLAGLNRASERFPSIDGLGTGTQVTMAALDAGPTITWATWAKAQPDLRLTQVMWVTHEDGQPVMRALKVAPGASSLKLPEATPAEEGVVTAAELWLTAQDGQGRQWLTRYAVKR